MYDTNILNKVDLLWAYRKLQSVYKRLKIIFVKTIESNFVEFTLK